MNLEQFLTERKPSWQRLETLLQAAGKDLTRLSAEEIQSLSLLYRQATSDLALAQRDFPGQKVTVYLNHLVGRAHTFLYRDQPLRWRGLLEFYRIEFPQLYRALLPYTILSFSLFVLAAIVAFAVVWRAPDAIYVVVGPQIDPLVRQVEKGELWTDIAPAFRSGASALILTNNIRVTFIAFAGGITAGLLTAFVVFTNGLNLGAIFGLLQAHQLGGGLLDFVVAHGFIELSVIFLAGGCGLYVGDGLLRPGLHSRRTALVQRAGIAVRMILGCAPLLIVAGLIEGFVSPSGVPWFVKAFIGIGTGLALHAYWLGAGRGQNSHTEYRRDHDGEYIE